MSEELKPCPFCGGNGRFSYGFGYEIYCEECGSRGNTYPSKEQAILRWNNRFSPWHTGTPTEDGWYLVVVEDYLKVRGEDCRYQTDYFNKYSRWRLFEEDRIIAWCKIKSHKRIASKA